MCWKASLTLSYMSHSEENSTLAINYPKTMKYDIHQKEVWVSTTFAFPDSDSHLLADSTQLLIS